MGAVAVTATATALVTSTLTAGAAPLSAQEVEQRLAAGSTASGTADAGPGATAGGDNRVPSTDKGSIVLQVEPAVVTVRCDGGLATLESWSPNPGYRADDPVRGPAAQVSIRFESDTDQDYRVTVSCDGSSVKYLVEADHDDHGGDGGDRGGPGRG